MQNANYFGMMKYKMPKFSGSCLVPSEVQNLLSSLQPFEALLGFFGLFRPKYKMESSQFFAKKNCMVFSSIMQNDGPKPKIYWDKGEVTCPTHPTKKRKKSPAPNLPRKQQAPRRQEEPKPHPKTANATAARFQTEKNQTCTTSTSTLLSTFFDLKPKRANSRKRDTNYIHN
jgi:uncharacterized Zn finger protein (UPF0148 family)